MLEERLSRVRAPQRADKRRAH